MAALLWCLSMGAPAAFAVVPPHVADGVDTDSCAICHRAHTAASEVGFSPRIGADVTEIKPNALIVGTHAASTGDTELCFSCHGAEGVGATKIVQDDFLAGSGHQLAPAESPYGPKYKECSSCHDSHGTAKLTSDAPYPGLLRSVNASGFPVYAGDDYCVACHSNRPQDTWDGNEVWKKTAHASLATSSTGNQIVCLVCHQAHGSTFAPTIRATLSGPAVSEDTTLTGNDRSLCVACHETGSASWYGASVYEGSAHGASATTVTARGEWAAGAVSRRVGECQNCHAPMGSADASGDLVPKLLEVEGRRGCDSCHKAGGPAATDIASTAYAGGGRVEEILAAYGATPETKAWGSLDVFTRDSTSSPTLLGPRRFVNGGMRSLASGDIDGDGVLEVVALHTDSAVVSVLSRSAIYGLADDPGDVELPLPPSSVAPADFIAIADVIDEAAGLPELITARAGDPIVRVYRWTGTGFGPVDAVDAGAPVTGLAAGRVTGSAQADVVVTLEGPSGSFAVLPGGSSLSTGAPVPARPGAGNPTLVDVDGDNAREIVLSNSLDASANVSVVEADGTELAAVGTDSVAAAKTATIVDVLPNVAGEELVVGYAAADGSAKVAVFPREGSGFGAPQETVLPPRSEPAAVATGDVDGDGLNEATLALAGSFSRTGAGSGPGIAIVHANADGTGIDTPQLRFGGGVEAAGSADVIVADVGDLGPSRHPVGEGASHVSTETVPVAAHVECADCHNAHTATDATATAPAVIGQLRGAAGVGVEPVSGTSFTLVEKRAADYEYEVCLKCHSTWSTLKTARSIASEVSTLNASFHPVEGPSPATNATGTLVATRDSGSMIYCSDCHGSAGDGPRGPHSSSAAPLLVKPYVGRPAVSSENLCFNCHKQDVYAPLDAASAIDGTPGVRSGFYDVGSSTPLHKLHSDRGFSCDSCHVSHGSPKLPFLVREDLGASFNGAGGECSTACHTATHAYQR